MSKHEKQKRTSAYRKAIAQVNRDYARMERKQSQSAAMLVALQHERNERLARIAMLYHTRQFPFE